MKRDHPILYIIILGMILVISGGCAKKRPVDSLLPEAHRLDKSFFTDGNFYYSVTVVGASANTPATHIGDQTFGESLITFDISEKFLTAHLVDSRYQDTTSLNEPLISFPIEQHVDIEREKNADDELTHREVETSQERPWNERKLAKINLAQSTLIPNSLLRLSLFENFGCLQEIGSDLLDLQQDSESLNLRILKTYKTTPSSSCSFPETTSETFTIELKFSFLKKKENKNFKSTPYTQRQQKHVGFFKTTVKTNNKYNLPEEKDYAIHWDQNKKVVYHLSPNFPKEYKSVIEGVFNKWNEALADSKVANKPLLELKDNTGQELGDLRYNFIVWINDPIESGPGGYGPMRWDPLSGEIFNANAYIFAGNYRQSLDLIRDHTEMNEQTHSRPGVSSATAEGMNRVSIDKDILNAPVKIKKFFEERADEKTLKGALTYFEEKSGRCYYPIMLGDNVDSWYAKGLSEEEIFKRLIADALTHELGHNLGLRHNFKGSVDKKHFISEESQTSSVMDYLDIEDSEDGTPGPYDREALSFAFNGEFNFQENYLYCSDEEMISDPFCNIFDRGTTAKEISQYLASRYFQWYPRRNFRGKRLHFRETPEEVDRYIAHLLIVYFLPLREFMDYYLYVGQSETKLNGDLLTAQQLESFSHDLLEGTANSLNFFAEVLLEHARPYQSIIHPHLSDNELLIRGTYIDKILMTELLTLRHLPIAPWENAKGTYFDIPTLQNSMLSLLTRTVLDPQMPTLIAALSAYRFMSEVPKADHGSPTSLSRPTENAAQLFKITKMPATTENIASLQAMGNTIAYVVDEEEGIIYSASKNAILFVAGLPMATLIETYNQKKNGYKTFIKNFTHDSAATDALFSQKISELEQLESIISHFPSEELSPLDIQKIDFIETLFESLIIINSKERLLYKLQMAEAAVESHIEEIKEKMKPPSNEAPSPRLAQGIDLGKKILKQITDLKQRVEPLSNISELSEELRLEIEALFKNIYGRNREVITTKTKLSRMTQELKIEIVNHVYELKKELDHLRFKIELYHMLYTKRGMSLE